MAPLVIAGISFFGLLYNDLYYTSWFEITSINTKLSGILSGVSYGGIGIALCLSAVLRLGPAWRLLGAGLGFLAIGTIEAILRGVTLQQNVYPGIYEIQAGGYLVIACILLASALIAPSISPGSSDTGCSSSVAAAGTGISCSSTGRCSRAGAGPCGVAPTCRHRCRRDTRSALLRDVWLRAHTWDTLLYTMR